MQRFSMANGMFWGGLFLTLAATSTTQVQAQVSPAVILNYKPIQKDVDYDTPAADQAAKCKLESIREGKATGYLLLDPQGLVLRRFMDTNADGKIDQFQYYKQGLEVYRDKDTDGDEKNDEFRWVNTGGTRWGVDADGDGRINSWKKISAEEASREAIRAMISGDEQALLAVLINVDDTRKLELTSEISGKLTESVGDPRGKVRQAVAGSKVLTPKSQWMRFDTSMLMPNLIPGGSGKSLQDIEVYENVMAIVDNEGQSGFVQIGEMVRVGDVWKLTQIPKPVEGEKFEAEGGLLLQPSVGAAAAALAGGLSPEVQDLLQQMRQLDEAMQKNPQPKPEDLSKYNVDRAKILSNLANKADDKELWMRQLLEHISAATQMAAYPNGIEQLTAYEQHLRKEKVDPTLVAFATWQRILADYHVKLQKAAQADRAKVQEQWLKTLDAYVKEFPKAENAADALLQVAITHEYNGSPSDLVQAQAYYGLVVKDYGDSPTGARAKGALRRMTSQGKPLALIGQKLGGGSIDLAAYKGRTVLVLYWATWCQPCIADLPQIQELYKTHRAAGFEVVGVCLDEPGAPIQEHIQQYKIEWPHIHEPGATLGRPAIEYGVVTLPTMLLADKEGKIVLSNATVEDLKKTVPGLVGK